MSVTMLVAGAMLAQALPAATFEATGMQRVDVGYEQLAGGDPDAAIATIRENRELAANDPVALINLGAAHARLGHKDQARAMFRAAALSGDRYDVQLADGRWMDSRRAALIAMEKLDRGGTLALR